MGGLGPPKDDKGGLRGTITSIFSKRRPVTPDPTPTQAPVKFPSETPSKAEGKVASNPRTLTQVKIGKLPKIQSTPLNQDKEFLSEEQIERSFKTGNNVLKAITRFDDAVKELADASLEVQQAIAEFSAFQQGRRDNMDRCGYLKEDVLPPQYAHRLQALRLSESLFQKLHEVFGGYQFQFKGHRIDPPHSVELMRLERNKANAEKDPYFVDYSPADYAMKISQENTRRVLNFVAQEDDLAVLLHEKEVIGYIVRTSAPGFSALEQFSNMDPLDILEHLIQNRREMDSELGTPDFIDYPVTDTMNTYLVEENGEFRIRFEDLPEDLRRLAFRRQSKIVMRRSPETIVRNKSIELVDPAATVQQRFSVEANPWPEPNGLMAVPRMKPSNIAGVYRGAPEVASSRPQDHPIEDGTPKQTSIPNPLLAILSTKPPTGMTAAEYQAQQMESIRTLISTQLVATESRPSRQPAAVNPAPERSIRGKTLPVASLTVRTDVDQGLVTQILGLAQAGHLTPEMAAGALQRLVSNQSRSGNHPPASPVHDRQQDSGTPRIQAEVQQEQDNATVANGSVQVQQRQDPGRQDSSRRREASVALAQPDQRRRRQMVRQAQRIDGDLPLRHQQSRETRLEAVRRTEVDRSRELNGDLPLRHQSRETRLDTASRTAPDRGLESSGYGSATSTSTAAVHFANEGSSREVRRPAEQSQRIQPPSLRTRPPRLPAPTTDTETDFEEDRHPRHRSSRREVLTTDTETDMESFVGIAGPTVFLNMPPFNNVQAADISETEGEPASTTTTEEAPADTEVEVETPMASPMIVVSGNQYSPPMPSIEDEEDELAEVVNETAAADTDTDTDHGRTVRNENRRLRGVAQDGTHNVATFVDRDEDIPRPSSRASSVGFSASEAPCPVRPPAMSRIRRNPPAAPSVEHFDSHMAHPDRGHRHQAPRNQRGRTAPSLGQMSQVSFSEDVYPHSVEVQPNFRMHSALPERSTGSLRGPQPTVNLTCVQTPRVDVPTETPLQGRMGQVTEEEEGSPTPRVSAATNRERSANDCSPTRSGHAIPGDYPRSREASGSNQSSVRDATVIRYDIDSDASGHQLRRDVTRSLNFADRSESQASTHASAHRLRGAQSYGVFQLDELTTEELLRQQETLGVTIKLRKKKAERERLDEEEALLVAQLEDMQRQAAGSRSTQYSRQ